MRAEPAGLAEPLGKMWRFLRKERGRSMTQIGVDFQRSDGLPNGDDWGTCERNRKAPNPTRATAAWGPRSIHGCPIAKQRGLRSKEMQAARKGRSRRCGRGSGGGSRSPKMTCCLLTSGVVRAGAEVVHCVCVAEGRMCE